MPHLCDTLAHVSPYTYRWLKPGGAMLPDKASLYIAGAGGDSLNTGFWRDVYGFSMAPVAEDMGVGYGGKALVAEVAAGDVMTQPIAIRSFDLATMGVEETDFSAAFHLPVQVNFIVIKLRARKGQSSWYQWREKRYPISRYLRTYFFDFFLNFLHLKTNLVPCTIFPISTGLHCEVTAKGWGRGGEGGSIAWNLQCVYRACICHAGLQTTELAGIQMACCLPLT